MSAGAVRVDETAPGGLSWWGRSRRRARQWPWLAIATFIVTAALAGVMIVVGRAGSSDLSFELAKAGIQLLAIVIFGGAVAAAFRSLDARREDMRSLDAYRAATVDELWDAYRRIKAMRRGLRASGFDRREFETVSAERRAAFHRTGAMSRVLRRCGIEQPGVTRVSGEQSADFHTRMEALNDAQLALEKLAQVVRDQERVFGASHMYTARLIDEAEEYVGCVLKDWEDHGQAVQEGADLADLTQRLTRLKGFLGKPYAPGGVVTGASQPIKEAATVIQSLRFGGDSASGMERGIRSRRSAGRR